MSDKASKKLYAIIAFVLPAVLLSAALAGMGIYPFGDKSILIYDLRSQYADFFAALREAFTGGGELIYSLSRAFGGDMFTLTAYYLFSPFNLIVLFFPKAQLIAALTCIYYLKIMTASFALWQFLTRTAVFRLRSGIAVIFALCYSFCGFAVMYAQNLMWLDALYILPLTLLAVESAACKSKRLPLTVLTAFALITNFYTALPIIVFVCVYYGFLALYMDGSIKTNSVFALLSALCTGALISAPVTMTAFCKLAETKLSDGNILTRLFGRGSLEALFTAAFIAAAIIIVISEFLLYKKAKSDCRFKLSDRARLIISITVAMIFAVCTLFDIGGFIKNGAKLVPFAFDRDTPQLYSSSLCVLLSLIPIIRAVIFRRPRELAFTALITAAALPTVYRPLDIILHMGQNPISFPARYSYIISFAVIFAAAYSVSTLNAEWFSRRVPSIVMLCAATVTVAELGINCFAGYKYNESVYYGYYQKSSYDAYVNVTESALQICDTTAGRVEKSFYRYLNDSLTFGYNGMSHYSSMYSRPLISLMNTLGYAASEYWSSYFGSTPVLDALFDVKYLLNMTDDEFCSRNLIKRAGGDYAQCLYKPLKIGYNYSVYENNYAMGMGYVVADSFDALSFGDANPFETQNLLVSAMAGEDVALFTPIEPPEPLAFGMTILDGGGWLKAGDQSNLSYMLTATQNGTIYMYLDSTDPRPCEIKVNGEKISDYRSSQSGVTYTLCLGGFDAGELINVALTPKDETLNINKVLFYALRADYTDILASIPKGETKFSHTERVFTFATTEGGTLFTSLPYENGWTAQIDGEQSQHYAGAGAFICVKIPNGAHIITLNYTPPGLYKGVIFGLVGLTLMIIAEAVTRKRGH